MCARVGWERRRVAPVPALEVPERPEVEPAVPLLAPAGFEGESRLCSLSLPKDLRIQRQRNT